MITDMDKLLSKIQQKIGVSDLLLKMRELSASQLNTFLLELFRQRTENLSPPHLLRNYDSNRYVWPSSADPIKMKELELRCLKKSKRAGFKPVNLSPIAPMGTCAAMAPVNQNNVLSALRGTEVVSDATNVLALKMAAETKSGLQLTGLTRLTSAHRHIRCQPIDNPDYSAHFSVLALVSGGRDQGHYLFEIGEILTHIRILIAIIQQNTTGFLLHVRFFMKKCSEGFRQNFHEKICDFSSEINIEFVDDPDDNYYQMVQYKIYAKSNDLELDLADGGIVDWSQQILSDKKQRMCISGIGLELLYKLTYGNLAGK